MTKQEQIEEMAKIVDEMYNVYTTTADDIAEGIYNAGYRKVDEFEECRKCPAWSGTDCTRNPYTEGCLDDKVNLKNEIKRLEEENTFLLKAREEKFTFDTTQNKKYSIFNSVRKDFAERLKERFTQYNNTDDVDIVASVNYEIDELLKEYE